VKRFGTASARAAALLADSGDLKHLDHAVELLRGSPRRGRLPAALLALGRAQRHAGQRRAARATLREALALAQRLGAGEVADGARDELRVAGARPRRDELVGPASLTTAERRVADAATAGATNREIAAQLFLSPKTVEMHLGRVYRKLDIRSRADLPGALGAAAA
jgi:DNA-binding CsgD family transcriptional regulator